MELLAPAGSPEAVTAAVQNGADAVYLGCGSFNARRNAAGFTEEELKTAVEYCHLRGVKVYLTLNTLLYDRELETASALVRYADSIGVDALLVQDLGVLRMVRQTAPDMPIHASTQMTLHNLPGVRLAAEWGVQRVVLSRELSKERIAALCAASPVELEVFVHGALCMCYSGQCCLSSIIGGRSGNRGLCAQPCRLKYGWRGRPERELLSLKDLSLAKYLQELEQMGVACVKIEGRMKRPEYVAVVTRIYASLLREGRLPSQEELQQLELAFSRQGFTDGYYRGKTGPAMFGVHKPGSEDPTPMFRREKASYSAGEIPRVPVSVRVTVEQGRPVGAVFRDEDGHAAVVTGPVPEAAQKRALTAETVTKQLEKSGGTPYRITAAAEVEPALALSASALNQLRRDGLAALSAQRIVPPARRQRPWTLPAPVRTETGPQEVVYAVSIQCWEQITEALLALHPARVDVPLELVSDLKRLKWLTAHCPAAVIMPRILWDNEREEAVSLLQSAKRSGVVKCLCSTWGGVQMAKELGFQIIGDYGLGVTNSETLRGMKEMGLCAATLSFEQRLARLRDLSRVLPTELLVYGRLPLMITENCIIANRTGGVCRKQCRKKGNQITDRTGTQFPVVYAYGCRNEILNGKILYMADKPDYRMVRAAVYRLRFTLETPAECMAVLRQYLGLEGAAFPENGTRGLYYRDVE